VTFEQFIHESGIDFAPVLDGEVHRYQGPGQKEKDSWYQGSQYQSSKGEIRTITIGDWQTGNKKTYRDEVGLSGEELKALDDKREADRIAKEEEKKKRAEAAKAEAIRLWKLGAKPEEHPYILKKKIKPNTIRAYQGMLLIPMSNEKGEICGIQKIYPDGQKMYLSGQRKKGLFHGLPGIKKEFIYLCEGYATGASINEVTGVATIIAFDAGNLLPVAESLRNSGYHGTIVVCADNDAWKPENGNPGVEAAHKVFSMVENCRVTVPDFSGLDCSSLPTDFNDLFILAGSDETKRQLTTLPVYAEGERESGRDSRQHRDAAEASNSVGTSDSGPVGPDEERPYSGDEAEGESQENVGGSEETESEDEKKKKISAKELKSLCRKVNEKFKIYHTAQASLVYMVVDKDRKEVVACMNDEMIIKEIRKLLRCGVAKGYKVYKAWRSDPELELDVEPKTFTWANEDTWSFKKLDFIPKEGEFPAWQEFLNRLSGPEEFKAFVWSIFEPKNRSRQFVYLYDMNGQGGKSTVIRVLGKVFGNSFGAITNTMVTGGGNRWLISTLYGKRFVAWADCKNPKFCMSEILRNVTSGDNVMVEYKGQAPFSTEMYLKLIVGSNHEPEITGAGADKSRLIRIDVEKNTANKDDLGWEERLHQELAAFLFACREKYEKLCPNHGNIAISETTSELIDAATDGVEARWEAITTKRLEIGEHFSATAVEWMELGKEENLSGHDLGNLKTYLAVTYGVVIKRVGKARKTVYLGFKIRPVGSYIPPAINQDADDPF
jgi:phage/plasmid primase-like uncharacterized protein